MGDFNCRLGSITRDKMVSPRGNLLKDFFKTTKSSPLSNQQVYHWTCYTWNGQSVNNILLWTTMKNPSVKITLFLKINGSHLNMPFSPSAGTLQFNPLINFSGLASRPHD